MGKLDIEVGNWKTDVTAEANALLGKLDSLLNGQVGEVDSSSNRYLEKHSYSLNAMKSAATHAASIVPLPGSDPYRATLARPLSSLRLRVERLIEFVERDDVSQVIEWCEQQEWSADLVDTVQVLREMSLDVNTSLMAKLERKLWAIEENATWPENEARLAELTKSTVELNVSADALLRRLTEEGQRVAANRYVKTYRNQSDEHKKSFWLYASILLIVLFGGGAALIYWFQASFQGSLTLITWFDLVPLLYPKLPAILAYIVLVVVLAKFVVAERHNQIVNTQKALALEAFQLLTSETTDAKVRDAVLLQATTAIFSLQNTGFNKAPVEIGPTSISFPDHAGQ